MTSRPEVSVFVSALQLSAELVQCLTSIQNQTFASFECVLCVPQELAETAQKLLQSHRLDSRFAIHSIQTSNETTLLSSALKNSLARFVTFVAAHDLLAPTYLQATLEYRDTFNADYVVSDCRFFNDARTIMKAPARVAEVLAFPWLSRSLLCKREELPRLNESLPRFHTADLLLKLMSSATAKPALLASPLYLARVRRTDFSSLTRSLNQFMSEHSELYTANWKEVLAEKDRKIFELSNALTAEYETLKTEQEHLQNKHTELTEQHEKLQEHHARSLASIKVTGTHLLRAIFCRFPAIRN